MRTSGCATPRAPKGVVALAILKVILDEGLQAKGADAGALRGAVKSVDLAKAAEVSGIPADAIKRVAHDFAGAKGALALGGGAAATGPQATDTLMAVNLLNVAVGAVGNTVRFGADSALGKASPYAEMVKLTKAMAAGEIEILIVADANPVYGMPPKAGLRRGAGQGASRGEPRDPPHRDVGQGRPRAAGAPHARVLGRLRRAGRRRRADAADDGARA